VFTVEIINPGQFRALARGWSAACAKINLHLSDYASGKFISVRFPFVPARAEQLARSHEMSFTLLFCTRAEFMCIQMRHIRMHLKLFSTTCGSKILF